MFALPPSEVAPAQGMAIVATLRVAIVATRALCADLNIAEFLQLLMWGATGPAGLAVKPLGLHVVNVGSIPTGPTHGEA